MPANVNEARSQMMVLFRDALAAESTIFSGFVTIWDNVEKQPAPPVEGTPWCRIYVRHNAGRQVALTGANRTTKWQRSGFLIVQLFEVGGGGLVSHDEKVNIILGAYEGKTTSGGLVFRNGRFQEVGQSGPWYQTNLYMDFEYEQVR